DTASTFDVARVEHVGRGSRLSTTSMITVKAVVVNRSAWSLSRTENRSRLGWPDRAVAVMVHAADNAEVRRDSGCAATTRVVGIPSEEANMASCGPSASARRSDDNDSTATLILAPVADLPSVRPS